MIEPDAHVCDLEVVRRALRAITSGGEKPRTLTEREKAAVAHYLHKAGRTPSGIATALNINVSTAREMLAKPDPLRRVSLW